MSAPATVLFVDDEPSVLRSIQRILRHSDLQVQTAGSGAEAIALLETGPIDVLVSDMRMPGMDGAELLAIARERWPDTVRLLLTGHADQKDTVRAINAAQLFGYIAKPWDADALIATVTAAAGMARMTREKQRLEQENRAQAESLASLNRYLEERIEERIAEVEKVHARLKRNYMNSIKAFANLIEVRGGQLVGHGRRVADLARALARTMQCSEDLVQRIFVAGLLHDIGLIGMPDAALLRPVAYLEGEMAALHRRHASLGEQSLMALDDMQPVAALIRSHHERFDGKGFPDSLAGDAIELGARILAVADHHDELLSGAFGAPSMTLAAVRKSIERGRGTQFCPTVLDALLRLAGTTRDRPRDTRVTSIGWTWLETGMELAADLRSQEGVLLLAADHVLTAEMIERIRVHARREASGLQLQIKCASLSAARQRAA
jgi:response regulator RpfG family c-di-GMP phosphodiesterase